MACTDLVSGFCRHADALDVRRGALHAMAYGAVALAAMLRVMAAQAQSTPVDCGSPPQIVNESSSFRQFSQDQACQAQAQAGSGGIDIPAVIGVWGDYSASSASCSQSTKFSDLEKTRLVQDLVSNESLLIHACGYRLCMLERVSPGSEVTKRLADVCLPDRGSERSGHMHLESAITRLDIDTDRTDVIPTADVTVSNVTQNPTKSSKCEIVDPKVLLDCSRAPVFDNTNGKASWTFVLKPGFTPIQGTVTYQKFQIKIGPDPGSTLLAGHVVISRKVHDDEGTCYAWRKGVCVACGVSKDQGGSAFSIADTKRAFTGHLYCRNMRPGPAEVSSHTGGVMPKGTWPGNSDKNKYDDWAYGMEWKDKATCESKLKETGLTLDDWAEHFSGWSSRFRPWVTFEEFRRSIKIGPTVDYGVCLFESRDNRSAAAGLEATALTVLVKSVGD